MFKKISEMGESINKREDKRNESTKHKGMMFKGKNANR